MSVQTDVWDDDFMGREPSSAFLTTYLLANPHVKVLNVNSPWGSGKSFFLERWAKALGEKHVCVTFNAWETDYSSEPLIALIACIEQQVVDPLALESSVIGKGLVNVSSGLIKRAGPLILRGLIRKVSGVELDELLIDGASDATDDLVKSLIEDQAETKGNVESFKKEIKLRLSQAANNLGKESPAFIFVDELDRCRPTYAIELLERIKHFFDIEDCRFIVASDSVQLAHSIRAVYGQGFSSEKYLNRFFDAEYKLDNSDIFNLVHRYLPDIASVKLGVNVSGKIDSNDFYKRGNSAASQKNTVVSSISGFSENAIFLVGLCKYFRVELRELTNYIKQIKSAADTIGGEVHFFWLAYLVFFKSTKSEEYLDLWVLDKTKGRKSILQYNSEFADVVTFAFRISVEDVKDIASYYLDLINVDRKDLHSLSARAVSWREPVFLDVRDTDDGYAKLRSYKDVIELAHRLT